MNPAQQSNSFQSWYAKTYTTYSLVPFAKAIALPAWPKYPNTGIALTTSKIFNNNKATYIKVEKLKKLEKYNFANETSI